MTAAFFRYLIVAVIVAAEFQLADIDAAGGLKFTVDGIGILFLQGFGGLGNHFLHRFHNGGGLFLGDFLFLFIIFCGNGEVQGKGRAQGFLDGSGGFFLFAFFNLFLIYKDFSITSILYVFDVF